MGGCSGKHDYEYDLCVIGAGSGGITAAKFGAKFGAKTALIEAHRIGGDCTWTGCVPSKSLIKAAKIAHHARTAESFGVHGSIASQWPPVDLGAINKNVRDIQEHIYQHDESPELLEGLGIDVLLGHKAQFVSPNVVKAGPKKVSARTFVIATGAHPFLPKIGGLDKDNHVTYEQIFELAELPQRLVVVGGGPIGSELAQAFRRLGSEVTIVGTLLPRDDPEVATAIGAVFEKEGINIIGGRAVHVTRDSGETLVTVKLKAGDEQQVPCDQVLLSAGRKANVEGMDLDKAGVTVEKGTIPVDDTLRTNVPHIFAVGDCTGTCSAAYPAAAQSAAFIGGMQFTHWAAMQGGVAASNALMPVNSSVKSLNPYATFTDPEAAHVGLSEQDASKQHGKANVGVAKKLITEVDRAVCESDEFGFVKLVYLKEDGKLLGATIVSSAAGEMIGQMNLALNQGLSIEDIAMSIQAYPSYSFVLQVIASEVMQDMLSAKYPVDSCIRTCCGPAMAKDRTYNANQVLQAGYAIEIAAGDVQTTVATIV